MTSSAAAADSAPITSMQGYTCSPRSMSNPHSLRDEAKGLQSDSVGSGTPVNYTTNLRSLSRTPHPYSFTPGDSSKRVRSAVSSGREVVDAPSGRSGNSGKGYVPSTMATDGDDKSSGVYPDSNTVYEPKSDTVSKVPRTDSTHVRLSDTASATDPAGPAACSRHTPTIQTAHRTLRHRRKSYRSH